MSAALSGEKVHLLEAKEVRQMAVGRWAEIYSALAPNQFGQALAKPGTHAPCPFPGHGSSKYPSKDGFRFFPHELGSQGNGGGICNTCGSTSDGFKTLMKLFGWTFPEMLLQVFTTLGGRLDNHQAVRTSVQNIQAAQPPVIEASDPLFDIEDARRIRDRLKTVWTQAVSLDDPTARTLLAYFKARGISMAGDQLPQDIRLHPRLIYRDKGQPSLGFFPTMIAMFRDQEGRPTTLHRTYLNKNGRKAAVPKAKKSMEVLPYRRMSGGAIRLYPTLGFRRLHITEGIENALAVRLILDHAEPVWAASNATLLEAFEPPEEITEVWIWLDKDRNLTGEHAGTEMMNRLCKHGIRCMPVMPPVPIPQGEKTVDFRDLVSQYGAEVIRKTQFFESLLRKMNKHPALA